MSTTTATQSTNDWQRLFRPVNIALGVALLACVALDALDVSSVFGVPAHPLLVHVPVVLAPVLAIAMIAFAIKPQWRKQYGLLAGSIGLVVLASTMLAVGAGQALRRQLEAQAQTATGTLAANLRAQLDAVHDHGDAGEMLRTVLLFGLFFLLVQVVLDRVEPTAAPLRWLSDGFGAIALRVLTVLFAVGIIVGTVTAGHSGANATYGQLPHVTNGQPSIQGGGGGSDDGAGG